MNIVFWMDDPTKFDIHKDTTYLLIHESIKRNHTVYYANKQSFQIHNKLLQCNVNKIKPFQIGENISLETTTKTLDDSSISVIWVRCDPPFDNDYLEHMWLFNHFKHNILFMNNPEGIYSTNEKIITLSYPSITPKTLISKNKHDIITFINNQESTILKPTDGYGGTGIYKVESDDFNIHTIIDQLTNNETKFIINQEALDHSKGDKRILLLGGEILGAVLRKSDKSFKHNFMAGGNAYKTEITNRDRHIVSTISDYVKEKELHFVGIDIIDNHLTEINVTSPTCLQEINNLTNQQLQTQIIDYMEKKIA